MVNGTKVRVLCEHSFTGTIVRPDKQLADWFVVRLDGPRYPGSNGCLCIHRDGLAVRNEAA